MIDRIIIPNLRRRENKWHFLLGALHHAAVDLKEKDLIVRHIAHDGRDYQNTLEVRDAAIADGFKYFVNYDEYAHGLSTTRMAWLWTWNSAMRTIAEMPSESIALFLIDDVYPEPNWKWGRINRLAHEVVHAKGHGEFKGLQLHQDIDSTEYRPPDPLINFSILSHGWVGISESALLLAPPGAEILMEVFASFKKGPTTGHDIIKEIGVLGTKDDKFYKGFWHTIETVFNDRSFFQTDIDWGDHRVVAP